MKRLILSGVAILLVPAAAAAEFPVAGHWPDSSVVLAAGSSHVIGHDDGVPDEVAVAPDMYQSYREPVAVRTRGGRIIMLCHAGNRFAWPERSGQDLVATFSDDGGTTWSPPKVAGEHGNYSMQSHGLVYDARIDRVICLYTLYRWDFSRIARGRGTQAAAPVIQAQRDAGEDLQRQYMIYSDDRGETWSAPRDVTSMTATSGDNGHFGSSEGRQLTLGQHAGRLVLPGGQRHEDPAGGVVAKDLFPWISDDHGKSWKPGGIILSTDHARNYSCEARITELPDGSLLYNERTRTTGRQQSRSTDGGESWTPLEPAPELKATQCNGSLITLRDAEGALTRTLLCSLPTPGGRNHGVVYVSFDGGRTWPMRHNVVAGFFGYSSLVQTDRDSVALFYESNHYRDLRVMRLPVTLLTGAPASDP